MATGPTYNPLISPDACRVWLNELPKADPQALVIAVTDALGELPGRGGMDALKVVETLRPTVLQYLETLATRYADKLLPLMPAQAAALAASDRLTRRLAEAYADAIPQSLAATDEYLRFAALLHQRAVFWSVQGMIAYLRARQRVPDDLWNIARNTLASAERAKLTDKAVRDSQQADGRSSVAATYARGLLLHLCGARSMSGPSFSAPTVLRCVACATRDSCVIARCGRRFAPAFARASRRPAKPDRLRRSHALLLGYSSRRPESSARFWASR